MGGTIEVSSVEGAGATFSVEIPCRFFAGNIEPDGISDSAVSADGEDTFMEPSNELRVLIADDHPINQKLMRAFVERFGYQYEVVENGRQALDAVAYGQFDVVLMDVQMPEMDGITATAEIRKLPNGRGTIPVLAITANAMVGQCEAYLEQGFDGYVSKPIDTAVLRDEIVRVTQGRGASQAADAKTAARA